MEAETYPDVTLANNSTMEQHPLNASANNDSAVASGAKDTFVVLQPKRKRYQFSRTQVVVIAFISILVLVVAVLITAFLTKNSCDSSSACANCKTPHRSDRGPLVSGGPISNSAHSGNDSNSSGNSAVTNTEIPSQEPWSCIRLPRSVIPSFYDIRLKVDLIKHEYEGSVNITVTVNTSTKYIVFHRSVIDIDEKSISVTPKFSRSRKIVRQFEVRNNSFHVLELDKELEVGNTYIITVGRYWAKLVKNLRGLYLSWYLYEGEKRYLAVTQLQATDARRVFPGFDEPDMKARYRMSIIYQNEYIALTNMPVISTQVVDSEWNKRDFETTPVMSTYLLGIVVCDFKFRNYTFDSGYELKIWARRDAYSQTEYALNFAISAYNFFTNYFGTSDVVPKSDHVAVPDFSSGAMENWGLVVYRETSLLYDRLVSSTKDKYFITMVVAHEVAHTWFGNMVTMKWWDDLWLNEGFASLLMYIAMDHVYPEWNVFAIIVVDDILPVMVEDALTTSHSLSSKIYDPADITQYFDSISYIKGMSVLRMMMGFAGFNQFRDGLRLYVERYKFNNADVTQLWKTFTEALNHTFDVAMIMDTWTRQMGYPIVRIEDAGNTYLLHQERFLLDQKMGAAVEQEENPYGYKWYIPFTYVTQESPHDKKIVWLNLGSASIPKPASGWLLGNYDYTGYYRVMYDKKQWAILEEELMKNHSIFPDSNRAGIIGDAFTFARANLLDYEVALNLTRYLKKEHSYIPWQAFLQSIEFLRGMIANGAAYVQLQHYLRQLVEPVFNSVGAADKGDLPERYLRRVILSISCDVGVEKAVSYAKSMFANWMKHGTSLPSDLSMVIYSVGIREGGALEWDYVWNKMRSSGVATEGDMMMESLVHTQKPWLLWRYINWLFDAEKIRHQDVRFVVGYFSKTPLARMVALQFFMDRWDDLVEAFGQDPFLLPEVIPKVTGFVNTEFHFKQLQTLFKGNTPRSATKAVDSALALIKANIGWMNDNYEEITQWLDKHHA